MYYKRVPSTSFTFSFRELLLALKIHVKAVVSDIKKGGVEAEVLSLKQKSVLVKNSLTLRNYSLNVCILR